MKFNKNIFLVLVIVLSNCICFAGEPQKDTLHVKHSVTKAQLFKLVDSLLDLNSIDESQIEAISYYYSLLQSQDANVAMLRFGAMPATNFYDDFDETTVFQITPEEEFPETQQLTLVNDSLGRFIVPKYGILTSKFGWRSGRMHKGIDIQLDRGDAVTAAFDGMVRFAQSQGGFGNVIIIRHYNGLETVYAHLSSIKVKVGQIINAGELIGLGGSTGRSSGPHLHFEVRFKGQAINPTSIISFTENKIYNDSIVIKKTKYGICAFPSNATVHTIEQGDSWYEVAKQYGLSLKELCLLNGTDKRYYLKVGDKLRVN